MRPPPDDPGMDLTAFIAKVRFFLHPSFAPNHVVEIVKPPFSLQRRGWGEFPVRVQFHFKHPERNRPVDAVHHLKVRYSSSACMSITCARFFFAPKDALCVL